MKALVYDTLQHRWRMSVTRPVPWRALAAVGLMLALLICFYAVVSDVADEARARRADAARQASNALHCNAPRNVVPRSDCIPEPAETPSHVASR